MKITIIKKATKTAKPQGWCPVFVDDYAINIRSRRRRAPREEEAKVRP